MNSLYQQLTKTAPVNSNLQQLVNLFKNSNNPKELFMKLMQNNPQFQNIYFQLQKSGKNPKELFYSLANEKRVNPDSILKLLQ